MKTCKPRIIQTCSLYKPKPPQFSKEHYQKILHLFERSGFLRRIGTICHSGERKVVETRGFWRCDLPFKAFNNYLLHKLTYLEEGTLDAFTDATTLGLYTYRGIKCKRQLQWNTDYTTTTTILWLSGLCPGQPNPGEPVPEGTFRHLLDFLVQNEDNTGRYTNNPDGLPPLPD